MKIIFVSSSLCAYILLVEPLVRFETINVGRSWPPDGAIGCDHQQPPLHREIPSKISYGFKIGYGIHVTKLVKTFHRVSIVLGSKSVAGHHTSQVLRFFSLDEIELNLTVTATANCSL